MIKVFVFFPIRHPILVLGTVVDGEVPALLGHNVEIGLHSLDRAHKLQAEGSRAGLFARVHVNIDTGMSRLGVRPQKALELLRAVHEASHLKLAGVMTHISSPEGALDPRTDEQVRIFEEVLEAAKAEGMELGTVHISNSAGLFTSLQPLHDLVRPGISAFGILPGELPGAETLQPILSLKSQIVFMKDVPNGRGVGYGSTWRARGDRRIATVPVGYNDGVSWRLSNRGEVLIRGKRAPIVGRVSMDYTTIDITEIPEASVEDVVTFIGTDGDERISVEEIASLAETIAYEITCVVGRRVQRVCVGGQDLILPSQRPAQQASSPTGQTHQPTVSPPADAVEPRVRT